MAAKIKHDIMVKSTGIDTEQNYVTVTLYIAGHKITNKNSFSSTEG